MLLVAFPDSGVLGLRHERSFHVIAAKRRHSFPPIWLKMTLVNLPAAVRREALARTPVAAGLGAFGAFGALGALAAAGGACLVSPFTRRPFLFSEPFVVPSMERGSPYACLERSKAVII